MSLNGILSSALTALQTNSAALRTVSNNVANLNTENYARRIVNQETLSAGGALAGVSIAEVRRVVDEFLSAQSLSAAGSAARYQTQSGVMDQLNSLLGEPGSNTALTARLSQTLAALGQAALAPNDSASRTGVLSALQNLASSISDASSAIGGLQAQLDQQVSTTASSVNSLIKQVYELNSQISMMQAGGDASSALVDQRDKILGDLSELIGIRTVAQPDGRVSVSTENGIQLVGDFYGQLRYAPSATGANYNSIMLEMVNPSSGAVIGQAQAIDSNLSSGKLRGLLDMRDGALADLAMELGSLARATAFAFNAQHNANTSFPPPASMTGRNTGLLAGDALNFTGDTTFAITDSNGELVSRVDVDFDAATIAVDGGPATAFTDTVGGFATALNTALGGNGTASFTDGVLSIAASTGNGVVISEDASSPSARGGVGFSQFFGMNDVFRSAAPSVLTTGLSASDASGLAAGGVISLLMKGPNGEVGRNVDVNITAGMSIGDVVSALNTAMSGVATFTLQADGSLTVANAAGYAGYRLDVTNDTTLRGSTGMGFTQIFGLGSGEAAKQAVSFSVEADLVADPSRLSFAQSSLTSSTVAGDTVVGHGDTRGILALQNLGTERQTFAKAGSLAAQSATLADYAAGFYQDVATRSQAAEASYSAQSARLSEVKTQQAQTSGVNLDEELSNMMLYQQSYAAGARMLQVVQELYDTLLQIR